jgi:hypothetical protein
MERCSPGWLEEILEARQYAEAHHMVTSAKNPVDVPSSPMVDLVQQIRLELAVDRYQAKKQVREDKAVQTTETDRP